MNNVSLIGRLTSKAELRYTSSSIEYTKFTIAINRNYSNAQGQKETDFINIEVWRKQAVNVCEYTDKGSLVAITGRIQTGSYEDKEGNKRQSFSVVADSVQFLDSKKQDGQASQVTPKEDNTYDPFSSFGDSVSIDDNFLD